jgi:L-iditol 2-dehydrogenase
VCGTDVRIAAHGHAKVAPPQVLGHEVVGTIVESRCTQAQVGARVTVAPAVGCGECRWCRAERPNRCAGLRTIGYEFPGAFAPLLAVPPAAVRQGSLCPVPEGLGGEVACLAEPLACCLNGQELVGLGAGDRVVIVGAGPIGCLHARLAAARGAAQVVVVEHNPARRDQAQRLALGTVVADGAEVVALTDGGADVAIAAAGSAAVQAEMLAWLARGGRASFFAGLPPHEALVLIPTNRIHYDELTVVGAHGSSPRQNRQALELLAGGTLRADDLVTGRYRLAEVQEAFAAMASAAGLKSVVLPGATP